MSSDQAELAVTTTATKLEEMLFVHIEQRDLLVIECNECSSYDYEFRRGSGSETSGWLARAVAHFAEYHPDHFTD